MEWNWQLILNISSHGTSVRITEITEKGRNRCFFLLLLLLDVNSFTLVDHHQSLISVETLYIQFFAAKQYQTKHAGPPCVPRLSWK